MFSQNGRQVGVKNTTKTETTRAPAQTLVAFQEMKTYAVQYGDAQGIARVAVVAKIGDVWYMPPNGEEWAGKLRPISTWLSKQLADRAALQEPSQEIPKTTVDVFATGEKAPEGA